MIKNFCDKCGKEIKSCEGAEVVVSKSGWQGSLIVSKEICEDCKRELMEWLKSK